MERFCKPVPEGSTTPMAVARHPLHPMLATFPIVFYIGALCADVACWFGGDEF
ncbi:MAG: hypothetical protein JHC61_12460 [Burkholderiaceae bacterium]|nr:hypothetical protein [Burkholderiaceae bacterium]